MMRGRQEKKVLRGTGAITGNYQSPVGLHCAIANLHRVRRIRIGGWMDHKDPIDQSVSPRSGDLATAVAKVVLGSHGCSRGGAMPFVLA